jgi:hypothetical protein
MNEDLQHDSLAAARGIVFGVLLSLPFWLAGYAVLIALGACDAPL